MDDDAATIALANEVAAYLARHPAAAGTEEATLVWWLQRIRTEESAERLSRALAILRADVRIAIRYLPDGTRV
jgi:hypothetical protein